MSRTAPGEPDSSDSPSSGPGPEPSFQDLFPSLSVGVRWGLERTEAALRARGDPHLAYRTLHVGGTNGKGSVAALWASVLRRSGLRVGLYTSPHLRSFRERIQVDGRPVSWDVLTSVAAELRGEVEGLGMTFFEAATVLAFCTFQRLEVEVAVVEVGLGGRLDSTNVLQPLVTAVTNVALDHADLLGPDVRTIAREKAGILKPGVPCFTAEGDPEVLAILRGRAREVGAPLHVVDPSRTVLELRVEGGRAVLRLETGSWGEISLESPFPGPHQAANAALAVRSLEALPDGLRPAREAVETGVREVRWPGRLQLVEAAGGTWLLDVAHNTAGIRALTAALPLLEPPRPLVALVGVQGDKDWRSMLPPLFHAVTSAILTHPPSVAPERRWSPEEAVRVVGPACPSRILPDFAEALREARALAGAGTVIVTGSHHTVGDAMRLLDLDPFG